MLKTVLKSDLFNFMEYFLIYFYFGAKNCEM